MSSARIFGSIVSKIGVSGGCLCVSMACISLSCSGTSGTVAAAGGESPSGGNIGTGGALLATGGTQQSGGVRSAGGGTLGVGGLTAIGGASTTGGASIVSTGGVSSGGIGEGGSLTGGRAAGGTSTGGTLTGGTFTGGASTGMPSGGMAATGGSKATGGNASTGGTSATGGSKSTGGNASTGGTPATGGTKATGGAMSTGGTTSTCGTTSNLQQLQSDFVNLRFGMFIHFGILTYTGWWAAPNLDITQFNPTGLNPAQWADAAVSAKMKYGVLTTRHHDGFALWPSKASNFNVGHIPWRNGTGDVVREYVDAFRAKGLLPGLYYSIWDTTQGVAAGSLSAADLTYIKTQITELLTNYGPIPILTIDGWSWQMGHQAIAYQEIHDLVKSLQPNCLLTDHTHMDQPWDVDVVNFEEPKGAWSPAGNTYPSQQGNKVNSTGGNDWFWAPDIGGLMTVSNIVTTHLKDLEPKWTNFLLNCPPNRTGTEDAAIVTLLQQVGAAWAPNTARAPLPVQGPQNEHPYTPVSATATSGTAYSAIDGINDTSFHSMWQPTGALPQSVTLDLGQIRPNVGWLGCAPYAQYDASLTTGNVTSYGILTSTDGTTFTQVASGTWTANKKLNVATFSPVAARYVRFEVRAANGSPAVTEITVGAGCQ